MNGNNTLKVGNKKEHKMAFCWSAEIASLDSFQELTPSQQSQILSLAQQSDNLSMQLEMLDIKYPRNNTIYEPERTRQYSLLNTQKAKVGRAIYDLTKRYKLYRDTDKFERDPLKRV
jgi:hypothetical protein